MFKKVPTIWIDSLTGPDGNAFSLMARCRTAAREAGWSDKDWNQFSYKATRGDYNNLLKCIDDEFKVMMNNEMVLLIVVMKNEQKKKDLN